MHALTQPATPRLFFMPLFLFEHLFQTVAKKGASHPPMLLNKYQAPVYVCSNEGEFFKTNYGLFVHFLSQFSCAMCTIEESAPLAVFWPLRELNTCLTKKKWYFSMPGLGNRGKNLTNL